MLAKSPQKQKNRLNGQQRGFQKVTPKKGIKLSRQFAINFESKYSQRDMKRHNTQFDPQVAQLYKSLQNLPIQQNLNESQKVNIKSKNQQKNNDTHLQQSVSLNMISSSKSLDRSNTLRSKSPYKIRIIMQQGH